MEYLSLAINLTFVGMTVVFISLFLLSVIIYLSTKLLTIKWNVLKSRNMLEDGSAFLEIEDDDRTNEAVGIGAYHYGTPDPDAEGEIPEEIIAVIMAAIYTEMPTVSQNRLRIKSVRRLDETAPVWNKAGRQQRLAEKL